MELKVIDVDLANNHSFEFKALLRNVLDINGFKTNSDRVSDIFNDMLIYIADSSAYILGVFDNNVLIGFIWCYKRMVNDSQRLHINYFIVDEKHRNCGIGKELINRVFDYAKDTGIEKVELMVSKSNKTAMKFYNKNGFEEERVLLCKDI